MITKNNIQNAAPSQQFSANFSFPVASLSKKEYHYLRTLSIGQMTDSQLYLYLNHIRGKGFDILTFFRTDYFDESKENHGVMYNEYIAASLSCSVRTVQQWTRFFMERNYLVKKQSHSRSCNTFALHPRLVTGRLSYLLCLRTITPEQRKAHDTTGKIYTRKQSVSFQAVNLHPNKRLSNYKYISKNTSFLSIKYLATVRSKKWGSFNYHDKRNIEIKEVKRILLQETDIEKRNRLLYHPVIRKILFTPLQEQIFKLIPNITLQDQLNLRLYNAASLEYAAAKYKATIESISAANANIDLITAHVCNADIAASDRVIQKIISPIGLYISYLKEYEKESLQKFRLRWGDYIQLCQLLGIEPFPQRDTYRKALPAPEVKSPLPQKHVFKMSDNFDNHKRIMADLSNQIYNMRFRLERAIRAGFKDSASHFTVELTELEVRLAQAQSKSPQIKYEEEDGYLH